MKKSSTLPTIYHLLGESKGPLLVGTAVIALIICVYEVVGFDIDTNDLAAYIDWSYMLPTHASYESHMPGLPAAIAVMRLASLGWLSDTFLARAISYVAWVVAVILASQILKVAAPKYRLFGTYAFALAPLVGTTYVAFPTAACLARMCLLGALLSSLHRRWFWFASITAVGLLIHQAYYPIYLLLALACVLSQGMNWLYLIASGIPFLAYYCYTAVERLDWMWIHTGHQRMIWSGNSELKYPILDGILNSLSGGTTVTMVKSAIVLSITVLAFVLLIHDLRKRNWNFAAITGTISTVAVVAPANAIFLVVRLSPFLVFPGFRYVAESPTLDRWLSRSWVQRLSIAALVVSQLGWAYYRYLSNT